MISQVQESFNTLITFMDGLSNFDDTIRKMSALAASTRYDLDALTEKAKVFATQTDVDAFKQRTRDQEEQSQQKLAGIIDRVTKLEELYPRLADHEKRIQGIEVTLKAHAKLLDTHGELLEEHGERLHTREEIADNHAVRIMDLEALGQRHTQEHLQVQEQFSERQRTREALVTSMGDQFAAAHERIDKQNQNLENLKDSTVIRFSTERKQTQADVENSERRLDARMDTVRNLVRENKEAVDADLKHLEVFTRNEVDRLDRDLREKTKKLADESERQNRMLRKTQEENLKSVQESIAETQALAETNLHTVKQDIMFNQTAFKLEVNKKVDVFKDVVKGLGPEIEDIVRRSTGDSIKDHLKDYSKKIEILIDSKVSQDVIKQELAKKADVMALGAYTKKVDADALVANAMGEHAKQVEIFLMNTILDHPTKSTEASGASDGGVGWERIFTIEGYSIKHGECINELYQMVKDLTAAVKLDDQSQHYKALRAKPSNYISARSALTPLTHAQGGASSTYPHYMMQLDLPAKVTPRGSMPNSARSAGNGEGTDRSHYSSGGFKAEAMKAVSFSVAQDQEVGQDDVQSSGDYMSSLSHRGTLTPQMPLVSQRQLMPPPHDPAIRSGGEDAPVEHQTRSSSAASELLVLDLIEQELRQSTAIPTPTNVYESNSPDWKQAVARKSRIHDEDSAANMADDGGLTLPRSESKQEAGLVPYQREDPEASQKTSEVAPAQIGVVSSDGDESEVAKNAVQRLQECEESYPSRAQSPQAQSQGETNLGPEQEIEGEKPVLQDHSSAVGRTVEFTKLQSAQNNDAEDSRHGTSSVGGAFPGRSGGFTMEYKKLAKSNSTGVVFGSFRGGRLPMQGAGGGLTRVHKARPGSARPAQAVNQLLDKARRMETSAPAEDSIPQRMFPAAKKARPQSASTALARPSSASVSRFARGDFAGSSVSARIVQDAEVTVVPAPPSDPPPFVFKEDAAVHGTRRTASKPSPRLWFQTPAPSRALTALRDLDKSAP